MNVSSNAGNASGQLIVLRADQLWDGLAAAPSGPGEVLIQGGSITAIGNHVDRPSGATVIDLAGHTLTPGFIDVHVHVTLRPQYEATSASLSGSYKALLGIQALQILLMNGFTTVRDVMDMDVHGFTTVDLKHGISQGLITGPRLLVAPHMISATAGHGDGSALLAPDNFPVTDVIYQNNVADGVEQIIKAIRSEANRGADWIKFAATGGFSSPADDPSQTTYSQDEMNALVGTARDLGLYCSPHAYGDLGISRALQAGVRSIEHGSLAGSDTLKQIEQQGVYVVPTQFAVVRQARNAGNDAFWEAAGKPAYVRAKYQKYAAAILASAQNLAASQVKIVFGTDLGTFSFAENGAQEFGEMVTNGISIERALKAATSTAAEMLCQPDLGVLAVGKAADLVAMPGNPFQDITVTEQVDFVMKNGVVYKQP